jgi:hypothetical protein
MPVTLSNNLNLNITQCKSALWQDVSHVQVLTGSDFYQAEIFLIHAAVVFTVFYLTILSQLLDYIASMIAW